MQDKQKKKRLEGMLKAIQELKSEYYIGSEEAYSYLKNLQQTYELPQKVSDMTNNQLTKTFGGNLTYLATPERIVGLENAISAVSLKTVFEEIFLKENRTDLLRKSLRNPPQKYLNQFSPVFLSCRDENENYYGLIHYSEDIEKNPELLKKTIEAFKPYFIKANTEGINLDDDFGDIVLSVLKKEYENIRDNIDVNKTFPNCDIFISDLTKNLSNINWKKELSKENLRIYEAHRKKSEIYCFSCQDIVRRMRKDRVDHRLEYRRAVLCEWLSEHDIKTYENAIKYSNYMLTVLNSQKNVSEELKECCKFIRHLVGADKNFIKRYLEH
jgi:hypothetical protein